MTAHGALAVTGLMLLVAAVLCQNAANSRYIGAYKREFRMGLVVIFATLGVACVIAASWWGAVR